MRIFSRFALLLSLCTFLLLGFALSSEGQILLAGNFDGTSTGFNISSANSIMNLTNPASYQSIAQTFIPSSNANLSYILAPISYGSGTNSPAFTMNLESGSATDPSGTILDSWTNFPIPKGSPNDQFSTQFTPEKLDLSNSDSQTNTPVLIAGNTYWLITLPAVQDTYLEWNTTIETSTTGYYVNDSQSNPSWIFNNGPTNNPYHSSAFQVFGTPITPNQNTPEPGVLATLMSMGMASGGVFLSKFRKA